MPTTPNTISRSRRARTGTVTRIDDRYVGYERSYRRYQRYTITCEEHGTETNRTQYGDALDAARTPDAWCTACAPLATNRAERRARTARPAAGQPLGLNRRYGVEFEFFGIRRYVVQDWLNNAQREGNLSGWRLKSDPSVSGEGLELITPPLTGQDGLDQIRFALTWLNDNGAKVNRSCGTHVHHDAADLGIEGIKKFVKSYHANRNLIDWLVSPSRRADGPSSYCRPWSDSEVELMDRHSNERSIYSPTRYKTVNVQSFGRHGTVEVRQHQGTLSFEKIAAWIKLGQAFCDAAKVRANPVPAQDGIRVLFDRINLDEDSAAFLLGRAIQFSAPLAQVAGGAS